MKDQYEKWTLSEIEQASIELRQFMDAPKSWGEAIRNKSRQMIEDNLNAMAELAIHTPEGQARFNELRGEIRILRQLQSDDIIGVASELEGVANCRREFR